MTRQAKRKAARRTGAPRLAIAWVSLFVVAGVLGAWLAPYDPLVGDLAASLKPPAWIEGGSTLHLLGTDELGRDVASRLIVGARITLIVTTLGVVLAGIIGSIIGLLAGFIGGWVDEVLMRICDAALAIPILVVGLALAAVLGPGTKNVVLIVAAVTWAYFARLVRSEALRVKSEDFITAARLTGFSNFHILYRQMLPNVVNSIIVMATLQVGQTIIVAASLSFLGLGVPYPTPEWGLMLASSQQYLQVAPWLAIAPGAALALTVLSCNVIGDYLEALWDPKGEHRLSARTPASDAPMPGDTGAEAHEGAMH